MNDLSYAKGTSFGSGSCLCITFVFALFASVSPYWMWSTAWNMNGSTTTASTGTYIVSSVVGRVPCGWWASCIISQQWNFITSFNNTLCTGDFYELVGQFGFCTEEGNETDVDFLSKPGVLRLPPEVVDIQALTISTAVLAFVAMFSACLAPAWETTKMATCTALLSLAATCTAIGAFSVAASYDYYQRFRTNGWYLPFTTSVGEFCDTDTCLVLSNRFVMWWGPAFGGMVVAFCFAFFATLGLCSVVADTALTERIEKRYKDEDFSFRTGANANPEVPPVPPAQGAENLAKG